MNEISPVASSDQNLELQAMRLQIMNIVKQRQTSSLIGAYTGTGILAIYMFSEPDLKFGWILIFMIFVIMSLYLISIINKNNLHQLRPSYRVFNTFVYKIFAKVVVVLSVLRFLSNILRFLNPLHGFKDSGAASRSQLLLNANLAALIGYSAHKQLTPAEFVETYFKISETKT